jgi:hypothetical protein
MNKDIAREWIAALRSGEYPQGHSGLRNIGSENGKMIPPGVTYCCLGVLCEITAERAGIVRNEGAYGGYLDREDYGALTPFNELLPDQVIRLTGQPHDDFMILLTPAELEKFDRGEETTGAEYLATLNDSGRFTFDDIADMIERQYLA